MNGFQIHNSEFDCVHEEAVVHTMTVLLATLLADADKRGGVTGETLMRASVLGVDVACNLGLQRQVLFNFSGQPPRVPLRRSQQLRVRGDLTKTNCFEHFH